MLLVFFGFLAHALLPLEYRRPFFLFLSITAILGVFGLADGGWLLILGLVLIGITLLPISFNFRVALVLIAAAGLVVLRMSSAPLPWSTAIWPILGSMFMFRMIVYLYDLKHQKEPFDPSRTLSYFFLLPNVVFPLFPVVDYSTYKRTYYNEERYKIYQVGINWIFRGAFQLILYRYVSYNLLIAPEDVTNIWELLLYLVTNLALYLRVSGQFHIIVGILHIFGFNLPETHHNYFLASSFTDYWRRINIYWKDFMLKVFYYPVYFRLKKYNDLTRLVIATVGVFLVTWILHAYQWFWLRGTFMLLPQDMLFWGILGFLVVVNSIYEVKKGRKRSLGKRAWTPRELSIQGLKILGTFTVIAVLWSLWVTVSLDEWLALFSIVIPKSPNAMQLFPLLLIVGMIGGRLWPRSGEDKLGKAAPKNPAFFKTAVLSGLMILAIYLIGNPVVYSRLHDRVQQEIRDLRVTRLNDQDAALLERGYYEDLMGVNRFNSQLWEVYMKRPQLRPDIWRTEAGHVTGDFLFGDLAPSAQIEFYGKQFTTNQWGLRDKEYALAKPEGTYRVALLGASTGMGWGVADDESFEWLLEDKLNQENSGETYQDYEILNFSVSGYTTVQSLMAFEDKALDFEPDAIWFVAHPNDEDRVLTHILSRVSQGVDVEYDYLRDLIQQAGLNQQTSEVQAKRALKPHAEQIVSWAYRRMVEESQERGILPVMIVIPRIVGMEEPEAAARQVQLAEEAGFVVLDMADVYKGQDIDSILLESWDWHPNARGHLLIAQRLYEALKAEAARIPMGLPEQ
jgi:D-alanyl-lipoteichoic acid acyltransferase DltB (MBOAT superfamily)/lysophospholipase L1-like esterase